MRDEVEAGAAIAAHRRYLHGSEVWHLVTLTRPLGAEQAAALVPGAHWAGLNENETRVAVLRGPFNPSHMVVDSGVIVVDGQRRGRRGAISHTALVDACVPPLRMCECGQVGEAPEESSLNVALGTATPPGRAPPRTSAPLGGSTTVDLALPGENTTQTPAQHLGDTTYPHATPIHEPTAPQTLISLYDPVELATLLERPILARGMPPSLRSVQWL